MSNLLFTSSGVWLRAGSSKIPWCLQVLGFGDHFFWFLIGLNWVLNGHFKPFRAVRSIRSEFAASHSSSWAPPRHLPGLPKCMFDVFLAVLTHSGILDFSTFRKSAKTEPKRSENDPRTSPKRSRGRPEISDFCEFSCFFRISRKTIFLTVSPGTLFLIVFNDY